MKTFDLKQVFMDNWGFVKNEVIVFMAALVAPITPMLILILIFILMLEWVFRLQGIGY